MEYRWLAAFAAVDRLAKADLQLAKIAVLPLGSSTDAYKTPYLCQLSVTYIYMVHRIPRHLAGRIPSYPCLDSDSAANLSFGHIPADIHCHNLI